MDVGCKGLVDGDEDGCLMLFQGGGSPDLYT